MNEDYKELDTRMIIAGKFKYYLHLKQKGDKKPYVQINQAIANDDGTSEINTIRLYDHNIKEFIDKLSDLYEYNLDLIKQR